MNSTPELVRCEVVTTYLFYSPCCNAEFRGYAISEDRQAIGNCPCCGKPLAITRHGDTFLIEER